MDNDFDIETFPPGASVLIETEDQVEMGMVISATQDSISLMRTHKMDLVGQMTVSERGRIATALEDTGTAKLRVFAREAGVGFVRSYLLGREELVKICLQDAIEAHNELGVVTAMVPLMKPIPAWIPRERVKKIEDAQAYNEELILKAMQDSLDEDDEISAP